MNGHPYRTRPITKATRASKAARAWSDAATPLILAAGPLALLALCIAARAYEGPWLMPTTVLYSVVGYVAFLFVTCAVDSMRR